MNEYLIFGGGVLTGIIAIATVWYLAARAKKKERAAFPTLKTKIKEAYDGLEKASKNMQDLYSILSEFENG